MGAGDAVFLGARVQTLLVGRRQFLSREKQFDGRGLRAHIDLVVIDETLAQSLVLLHDLARVNLEVALLDDVERGNQTRDDNHDENHRHPGGFETVFRAQGVGDGRVFEVLDPEESRQRDEDAVDDKEVERAADIGPVHREAIAHRAERRHQGGRNRYAGKHRSLALAGVFQDAGQAAEECNQHVVNSGVGAGQQFRRILQAEGAEEEIQGGSQNADAHHNGQVLERIEHQIPVQSAQTKPEAQDGTHHRRNEHRADDDGNGVDIQAHGGYHNGESQDENVGAPEGDVLANGRGGFLQRQVVLHIDQIG